MSILVLSSTKSATCLILIIVDTPTNYPYTASVTKHKHKLPKCLNIECFSEPDFLKDRQSKWFGALMKVLNFINDSMFFTISEKLVTGENKYPYYCYDVDCKGLLTEQSPECRSIFIRISLLRQF